MNEQYFNPNSHLIKVGGKDYLQVQWRLVWYREQCPSGTIDTEEQEVDTEREVTAEVSVWNPEKRRNEKVLKTAKGYARYKAVVTDGKGGRATGHGSETAIDFADYVEKAETKAIGRALAALGFGTQFTGDEFNEAHRIVDAPVDNTPESHQTTREPVAFQPTSSANAPTPKKLRAWCENLYPGKWDNVKERLLGECVPDDNLTSEQCHKMYRSFEITEAKRKEAQQAS